MRASSCAELRFGRNISERSFAFFTILAAFPFELQLPAVLRHHHCISIQGKHCLQQKEAFMWRSAYALATAAVLALFVPDLDAQGRGGGRNAPGGRGNSGNRYQGNPNYGKRNYANPNYGWYG